MTPEFVQSNCMIERTIQTIKRTLLKCLISRDDKYLALLALRTAPGKEDTPSPGTKRMKRILRTLLPRVTKPTYQTRSVSKYVMEFCKGTLPARMRGQKIFSRNNDVVDLREMLILSVCLHQEITFLLQVQVLTQPQLALTHFHPYLTFILEYNNMFSGFLVGEYCYQMLPCGTSSCVFTFLCSSVLLFIPSWKENKWFHAFPNGISMK